MKPRVLVVEDDPSVRRFVQAALEALDVDLAQCATLSEAKAMLSDQATRLVITDLHLPDGSGLDLLAWMKASPSPQLESCLSVVFSGDVGPLVAPQLESLAVWRVLHKPASVGALVSCVSEALSSSPAGAPDSTAPPALQDDPVSEFFGGNRQLFEAYRQACLAQFPQDLRDGDAAVRAQDAVVLRRVAHNLKSVLVMLGDARAAQWARDTEERAADRELESMHAGWLRLKAHIEDLLPPYDA